MAKKRKTRQQKISATLRHNENPVTYSLSSLNKPLVTTVKPVNMAITPQVKEDHTYQFVRHDLLRTSAITGAIIFAELALFLVLR